MTRRPRQRGITVDESTSASATTGNPYSVQERAEFARLGSELGLREGEPYARCPRRGCKQMALRLDLDRLGFSCGVCMVKGRGLASLVRNAEVLRVPVSEYENSELKTFGELGHCPHQWEEWRTNGRQVEYLARPCNKRTCEFCGFLKFRRDYAHYALLLQASPEVYVTSIESSWSTDRKRLHRAGADYVRCPQKDGSTVIYSTKPIRPDDRPVPHKRWDETLWQMLPGDLAEAFETDCYLTGSEAWKRNDRSNRSILDDFDIPHDATAPDPWRSLYHGPKAKDVALSAVEHGMATMSEVESGRLLLDCPDFRTSPWGASNGLHTAADAEAAEARGRSNLRGSQNRDLVLT